MSKVSIIVPIYNVEKYIEKCIKSLVNQTFTDIEIWAISDGSPDNSMEIVKKFAKNDDRIKCIEKENGGYGSVLEYAIEKIETEYFLICDPDDWLEDNAIEVLYKCAEENKVDLVIGEKYYICCDNQENKNVKFYNSTLHPIEPSKVYFNLEEFCFMPVSPHSKLYKTKFAKKIQFPHHINYTDMILYDVYLNEISSAMYINIPLSNYLIDRPGNSEGEALKFSQKVFDAKMIMNNSIFEQLDKTTYLYSKVCYQLFRHLFEQMVEPIAVKCSKKETIEYKKQVMQYLSKVKSIKTDIKKSMKESNFCKMILKKMIIDLLFCNLTANFTLEVIMQLYRMKEKRGKNK